MSTTTTSTLLTQRLETTANSMSVPTRGFHHLNPNDSPVTSTVFVAALAAAAASVLATASEVANAVLATVTAAVDGGHG